LERLLREKKKIKSQISAKIAKIDGTVRDVKARYESELQEIEGQMREKEMKVAEMDGERSAVERVKRDYKEALVAFDDRVETQTKGLRVLESTIRQLESDIGSNEKMSHLREQERDRLREIESAVSDETDREIRGRLEEYEFEISEARSKLDSIACKLKEKKSQEQDLQQVRIPKAEADKKQAARDRDYKGAQRLRDAVAEMKNKCVILEQEMEELNVQQKEHTSRMEDAQQALAEEKQRLSQLQTQRNEQRFEAVERKVRALVSLKNQKSKLLKSAQVRVKEAAADESQQLDAAEAERKALAGDLELLELQVGEALAECDLLAERCGMQSTYERLKQLANGVEDDDEEDDKKVIVEEKEEKEEKDVVNVVEEEEDVVEHPIADSGVGGDVDTTSLQSRLEKAKSDLTELEAEFEQALEDEEYELAEKLDPRVEDLKEKVKRLQEEVEETRGVIVDEKQEEEQQQEEEEEEEQEEEEDVAPGDGGESIRDEEDDVPVALGGEAGDKQDNVE